MKVSIYGCSDDLVEIEGDITDEIDCYSKKPKLYVYSEDVLQFVIKTSFVGCWLIQPLLDEQTFEEEKPPKCKSWDISIDMVGKEHHNRYSMVLNINSGDDDFTITKRRKKK